MFEPRPSNEILGFLEASSAGGRAVRFKETGVTLELFEVPKLPSEPCRMLA
jgi:hypothetical protein